MSVYFVHCNLCTSVPSQCGQMYWASCGHLCCSRCADKGLMQTCPFCKVNVSLCKVSDEMSAKHKRFFTNPNTFMDKLIEKLEYKASLPGIGRLDRLKAENQELQAKVKKLREEVHFYEKKRRSTEVLKGLMDPKVMNHNGNPEQRYYKVSLGETAAKYKAFNRAPPSKAKANMVMFD